ncbi:MAG: ABC transporter substrate-binding protein [Actinomycetota bacterium]
MGIARSVAVLALFLSACTPNVSGPVPARPVEEQAAAATAPPTAMTMAAPSVVSAESSDIGPECPTNFCLRYEINPRARWADGSPITAADFAHTADLYREVSPDTPPYAAVSEVLPVAEHTVQVVFDEPNGAWQGLFSRLIRSGDPGRSIEQVTTTGPFRFDEWAEGEFLTLDRDPDWWAEEDPISGMPLGDVERIRFVFIDRREEMVDALENGDIDVMIARPDESIVAELSEVDGVRVALAPGPFWEHIDFHHDDPLLSEPWVREVFSVAIDREKILDRTVRAVAPDTAVLDNTIWMPRSEHYEPHFPDGFDPDRAREILRREGCVAGEDGVQVCGGERMSFRWASTDDDPTRRATFESVREDLEAVGIEVVGEFLAPSDFIRRDFLFGGPDRWQLINFSWRARPDPVATNSVYYCGDAGVLNVNRYCSERVEDLIRSTDRIVYPEGRAAVYNWADRRYLEDRALIPLYQKPTMMSWSAAIDGPEPNHNLGGDLWNVAAWSGKVEVIVALPSEPNTIDPVSIEDDVANVILGPLLYGAFGMDPSHGRLPVLVESVELLTPSQR